MRRFRPVLVLALSLLLAGCKATAQDRNAPALSIVATMPSVHSSTSNVIELHDGRVAFADPRERFFFFADFTSGKVDTLGRALPLGPEVQLTDATYKLPGWVVHLAGDTIALVDFAAIRTSLWGEDGSYRGALNLPDAGGRTPALVYDTMGHAYKADYSALLGQGQPGGVNLRPDSIALLRIAIGTGKVDTVGHLSAPEYGDALIGAQMQNVAKVFSPNDAFGVTGDGALWIARARTHSLDWRAANGTWSRGKPHEYAKVPVTETDRLQVLQRLHERGLPREVEVRYPFAETKPSFDVALASPAGEVWLQYSRASDSLPQRYAIFDTTGTFQRDVQAPPMVTVAGFGRGGAVYGAKRLIDGRRQLVRMK